MASRQRRARRTWPQRLILGLNVVVIMAALSMAFALSYARRTVAEIPRVPFGGTVLDEQPQPGEPLNFLLVGIDSATNLPEDSPVRAGRPSGTRLTDTLMVMRVDPGNGQASVLSVPRDLWVTHAQSGQEERINAAYALGGTTGDTNLVETIRNELQIPIHHYVVVDLAGFVDLVDLIDGVTLYIEHPLRDPKAQLSIDQTGCVDLTPEQALGFVRSRTLEEFVDGTWRLVDTRNDLGRNERQQDFLVAAIRKAIARGIRNPVTLKGLVDDGLPIVSVLDDVLTPADLLSLGEDFRDFRPETLARYSLPVVPVDIDGKSVLLLEYADAQEVLDVFRDASSEATSTVSVTVRNGTGGANVAAETAAGLETLGFTIAGVGDAETFDVGVTTIRHVESRSRSAALLARGLVNEPAFEVVDTDAGGVELVVGTDFAGVRGELAPREPVRGRIGRATERNTG